MDTRIPQLPYIPIPLTASTDLLEVAVVDGSSPTGYTSVNAKIEDILAFSPAPPIVPINEIAWGDGVDPYTSTGNFKYINGRLYVKGLNQTSSDMVIETVDSLNLPLFKVQNNGYAGFRNASPTAVIHAKATDTGSSNYVAKFDDSVGTKLFHIRNDARYIFNDSPLTMPDGGTASYGLKSGAYNWYFYTNETFLTDGAVSYSEQLGASYATVGTYSNHALKLRTNNADRMIIDNAGLVSINQNSIGAARLEITGGAYQGAYIQTSGSIGVNAVDATGYAVKGQTDSGTALRGNVTTTGGIGIEIGNTVTAASLLKVLGNGAASFGGTLDGETSGNNNMAYVATNGGYRVGYYGQTGYNTIQDFYTNGVKNTQIYEGTGYYALSAKNRWSIKTFNDNKSHLWMDGSTGYIGIGENYFAPSTMLHVGNIANTAIRNDSNAAGAYTGKKFEVEVGGGQWGWGYSAANNALTALTTGSSTGNFIFGYGTEASPIPHFNYDSVYGGLAVNVALGSMNAAGHFKMIAAGNPTDNILLAETFGGTKRFFVQNDGKVSIGSTSPTSQLDLNAANGYEQLRLRQNYTPSSTADANGNTGDVAWDASYFYLKTGAGAWGRVAWDFSF